MLWIESVGRVTLDGGGVPKMAVDRDSHTIVQLCQRDRRHAAIINEIYWR